MKRITLFLPAMMLVSAQSQAPDTVIRINVNLVQVDAVVMDSKDRPVTDLKKEDFEILQDGKPQAVNNFSFITTATTRPAAVAVAAPRRVPRGRPRPPCRSEWATRAARRAVPLPWWWTTWACPLTASRACAPP